LNKELTIQYLVKRCKRTANEHGWFVTWKKNLEAITVLEALALIHSELSEALEEYRDDNKENFGKEIAGCLIRIFHLIGELDIDIEKYLRSEMNRNDTRPYRHGRKIL